MFSVMQTPSSTKKTKNITDYTDTIHMPVLAHDEANAAACVRRRCEVSGVSWPSASNRRKTRPPDIHMCASACTFAHVGTCMQMRFACCLCISANACKETVRCCQRITVLMIKLILETELFSTNRQAIESKDDPTPSNIGIRLVISCSMP